MMKNKLLIALVLALGVISAYLYFTQTKGTIPVERKDFAVEDTSAITKIFLADKTGKSVTLTRVNAGNWMVNGLYKARKDLISVLLKTIKSLKVQSPVAKSARNNVLKRLSSGAAKVEIYQDGDTPVKGYYVGGATQNTLGTYMLLQNSSEPFIIHLEHFYGYLAPRYNTDAVEWRDKEFVNIEMKDMQKVQIEYPNMPERSFSITNLGNWVFELKALQSGVVIQDYDTISLRIYLTNFTEVQFEGFERKLPKHKVDSIMKSPPVNILSVTASNGAEVSLKSFLKPDTENRVDREGNHIIYDVDRMYANTRGTDELVTIQYYVFDKLFWELDDFLKSSKEKGKR